MTSARLTTIVLGMLGSLSGLYPGHVRAESQQGGLPALEARVRALEDVATALAAALAAETAARQAADAALQSAISSEAAARQAGDASLQGAINGEVAARQAGDATLQTAINNEAAARQAGDTTLQTAINNEVAARQAAVTTLQNQLPRGYGARTPTPFVNLEYKPFSEQPTTEVVSLNLPAGAYVLVAAITAVNADNDDNGFVTCAIPGHAAITGTLADEADPGEDESLVLTSAINHPGGMVRVLCADNHGANDNTRAWGNLSAVRVSGIN